MSTASDNYLPPTRSWSCQATPREPAEHHSQLVPGKGKSYVYAGHDGRWLTTCREHSGVCHPECWDRAQWRGLYERVDPARLSGRWPDAATAGQLAAVQELITKLTVQYNLDATPLGYDGQWSCTLRPAGDRGLALVAYQSWTHTWSCGGRPVTAAEVEPYLAAWASHRDWHPDSLLRLVRGAAR